MPTLPDVGRLGGGPYAGPGRAQVRMAVRGEEDADPGVWEVFAVGRGDGFVVLAEVTPRAASELRLADAARSGRPSRPPGGRLLGLNGIGPGLWARPAA